MFKKLLAAVFAATLMAGSAWGVDILDIGGATDAVLDTGSKASENTTTGYDDYSNNAEIQVGSSVGGNVSIGSITSTALAIVIGSTDGTAEFTKAPEAFYLTADSISAATASDGDVTINQTAKGIQGLTVLGDVVVGNALASQGLEYLTIGGDLTVTGAAAIGDTKAIGAFSVAGKADFVDTLDLGIVNGSGSAIFGTEGATGTTLSVGDVATILDTDVTVYGGAVFKAAMVVKGGTHKYDNIVLEVTGSTWDSSALNDGVFTVNNELTLIADSAANAFKIGSVLGTNTVANVNAFDFVTSGGEITVEVDGGAQLNVAADTTFGSDGTDGALLKVGANKAVEVNFAGDLSFGGNQDDVLTGTTGKTSLLTVGGDLTVGAERGAALALKALYIDVQVAGLTTVNKSSTLTVDGGDDVYAGGLVLADGIKGTETELIFGAADGTTITVGGAGLLVQNNGKITSSVATNAANDVIQGNVSIINVVDPNQANEALIIADTQDSALVIDGNLLIAGDVDVTSAQGNGAKVSGVQVTGSYTQNAGQVDLVTGGAGMLVVNGNATIGVGEGQGPAVLLTDATHTVGNLGKAGVVFNSGVTIGENGAIVGTAAATDAITIGDGRAINLDGGLLRNEIIVGDNVAINVTGNDAEIDTVTVAAGSIANLFVNTTDEETNGGYDFGPGVSVNNSAFTDIVVRNSELAYTGTLTTANDLVVNRYAFLTTADATAGVVSGNGVAGVGNSVFSANAGSTIELENDSLLLDNFETVNLNGYVHFGNIAGALNVINVDDAAALLTDTVNVGNAARFVFTPETANAMLASTFNADGTRAVEGDAFIITEDLTLNVAADEVTGVIGTYKNAIGQFTFARDVEAAPSASDRIYLDAKQNVIVGNNQNDLADRALMHSNLQTAWADFGADGALNANISANIYDAIIGGSDHYLDGVIEYDEVYSVAYDTDADGNGIIGSGNIEGAKNIFRELMYATAVTNTNEVSNGTIKTIFGNGIVSDSLNFGIGEVQGITSAIGARNVQIRQQLAAADVTYQDANASILMNNDYANRIWAGYIGQQEDADDRNGVAGYDYDSNGFIIGYDRLVGCNFAFGAAFAYSRGDYEDKGADSNSSKIDNYAVNGYMTYTTGSGAYGSIFGGYMHQKNDIAGTYRSASARSEYDADYWNIGGEFGIDFMPVDGLVLTPSVGVQYIHGNAESHRASFTSATGTWGWGSVADTKRNAFLLPIDVTARYNWMFGDCSTLGLEANVGYAYNFSGDAAEASMIAEGLNIAGNSVSFRGNGRENSRHNFNLGAGLRYTYNRFDIGVKYDYYLRQDANAHRVMGTLGVSF